MRSTLIIMLVLLSNVLWAQSFSEKITRELTFEKKSPDNTLMVSNINGSIKVTGYEGDKILVEVSKEINAKTDERLEKGKKVQLGVVDLADTLILFVDGICQKFERYHGQYHHDGRSWGYHSPDDCKGCREEFDYTLNFIIKVPFDVHLNVSTINGGDVVVENTKGVVQANNINGSIRLQHLEGGTEARTINGNLDVDYTHNPSRYCRYYTLNGDINALFQKGLAANLSFESFNGGFYTNIDKIDHLPAVVERSEVGSGIRYKISGNRYQVGSGGTTMLDFETFNGNLYLKEKKN